VAVFHADERVLPSSIENCLDFRGRDDSINRLTCELLADTEALSLKRETRNFNVETQSLILEAPKLNVELAEPQT